MAGFLDNEDKAVVYKELQVIAEYLLDEWINSNLDEGQLYSDWNIAEMSDSNYLKGRFNLFYDLKPEDQYYIDFDEEK